MGIRYTFLLDKLVKKDVPKIPGGENMSEEKKNCECCKCDPCTCKKCECCKCDPCTCKEDCACKKKDDSKKESCCCCC